MKIRAKVAAWLLGIALPVICDAGGGGLAGDFGDGIVLTPYTQPPLPPLSLRTCWAEYKPLLTFNGQYWVFRWERVEVCYP